MNNKIDTTRWKEFNISDLFEVKLSRDDLQPGKLIEGNIPLISSGKMNNGIVMYIEEQPKATLFDKNTITIDMFGQAFYQTSNYYSVSHGRVNILIPKFKITKNIGLFLVSIFKKSFNERYSFSTMCSSTLLKRERILLPVDEQINPDWEYMEQYMKNIEKHVKESLKGLKSESNKFKKINIIEWKEFEIGDLFDIHPTKAYKKNNSFLFEEGGVNPVVVNSCYNNGIGGYTNLSCTEDGNIITFSDTTSADSIFYQKKAFVGYPHVQGMYPIGEYKDKWNEYTYLFLITLFRKKAINLNYNYVNKFTRESARKIKIKLPIDNDGNPNWEYMEQYMMNLMKDTRENLNNFKSV